ncbi:hypothetical protein [Streptomyces sp. IBSBF 2950]|uniref:hypothetical protein n=1 Tax=Streptomyces sp. IBSBF 2950 TaxID=2903528 RepID=UPI002FDBFE34
MNNSRALGGARPPTLTSPGPATLLAAGQDGNVVAIGAARPSRPSRTVPSPPAGPRESRRAPSTGSPTLDCAGAGQYLAAVPDMRDLIDRMRNTTPDGTPDF